MIRESLEKVINGVDLSAQEMEKTMGDVLDGKVSPSQVGAFVLPFTNRQTWVGPQMLTSSCVLSP